ncbi:HAD family hydrolase [Candidatus Neomarinimicrobiota bacterium]
MKPFDAIIFDVDGVLVDTSKSFSYAVVDAVREATGSERFTPREVDLLKQIRGFNNDWHVAIAGGAWITFQQNREFEAFVTDIDQAGGGLAGLHTVVGEQVDNGFAEQLTRLSQEAYAGQTACIRLYGFEPETIRVPGRWREEVPLLSEYQMQSLKDRIAILTGRGFAEMELAFEVLGWRLPSDRVACSDNPIFDKPNPVKFLGLLGRMMARRALYVGDSRDDYEMVKRARQESRLEIDFAYVGRIPCPWPDVALVVPDAVTLIKMVEVKHG